MIAGILVVALVCASFFAGCQFGWLRCLTKMRAEMDFASSLRRHWDQISEREPRQ